MRIEKSCGAIVYKEGENGRLYLIEYTLSGHTSLPKGHVEDNETEIQTALREIKEETNLDVSIDSRFRFHSHYTTRKGKDKEIIFFTAVPVSWELVPQDTEIKSLKWLPLNEALEALEYEVHREALVKAAEYLDA